MIGNRFGSTQNVFNPKSISGCVLWLDGSDPAGTGTPPGNGSTLASWVDKSGVGNTYSQATGGLRPTFNTNVKNGKGAVSSSGTQYMNRGSSPTSYSLGSDGRTIFAVVSGIGPTDSGCLFAYGLELNNSAFNIFATNSTGYLNIDTNVNSVNATTTQLTSTNFYIEEINYTAGTALSSISLTVNGADQAVTGSGTVPNTSDGLDSHLFRRPADYPYTGTLCEIVMYNVSLSATNQTKIRNYLSNKWGI